MAELAGNIDHRFWLGIRQPPSSRSRLESGIMGDIQSAIRAEFNYLHFFQISLANVQKVGNFTG